MATESKLKQAVKSQASKLDEAQAGFVLAEYDTWEWNSRRIEAIENKLELDARSNSPMPPGDRKQLMNERHQLVTEGASLFSHIMRNLKGTGEEKTDEFDEFMRRG